MPILREELLWTTKKAKQRENQEKHYKEIKKKRERMEHKMETCEINPNDYDEEIEYQNREEYENEKNYSPIEQSLEQLDKSLHKLTNDMHHLFSKLEPCINKTKIKEIQQSKPKEAEPVPPKSVIRERINLMEDLIKNTNKDINMIIASLEL